MRALGAVAAAKDPADRAGGAEDASAKSLASTPVTSWLKATRNWTVPAVIGLRADPRDHDHLRRRRGGGRVEVAFHDSNVRAGDRAIALEIALRPGRIRQSDVRVRGHDAQVGRVHRTIEVGVAGYGIGRGYLARERVIDRNGPPRAVGRRALVMDGAQCDIRVVGHLAANRRGRVGGAVSNTMLPPSMSAPAVSTGDSPDPQFERAAVDGRQLRVRGRTVEDYGARAFCERGRAGQVRGDRAAEERVARGRERLPGADDAAVDHSYRSRGQVLTAQGE